MGTVVDIRKRNRPHDTPEKCFLKFSTSKEDGGGPVYVEYSGVSPQMIIVAEEVIRELKEVLFDLIQGGEEDEDEEV